MKTSIVKPLALSLVLAVWTGCSSESGDDNASTNAAAPDASAMDGSNTDSPDAPSPDLGTPDMRAPDAGDAGNADSSLPDADPDPDMDVQMVQETEPNDGTPIEAVNDLAVGAVMNGNIDADDTDIFVVQTVPGRVYVATLTTPDGSSLQRHLTVLDNGRGGDAPGQDYVKISRDETLEIIAMGDGGHLFIVRDARVVDGNPGGGAGHAYQLQVIDLAATERVAGSVNFGSPITGTLASAADVQLWTFDAVTGMDVVFDMNAPNGDGRLFVFSVQGGDWIARQDDRTAGNPNPLLDAPLFGDGQMMLVVENIAEDTSNVSYTIDTAAP